MDQDQDDFSMLLLDDVKMDCTENFDELIDAEINVLQTSNSTEDKLKSAKNLVLNLMPATSILVVENKVLKYLLPTLKTIYINIFGDIESIISSQRETKEKTLILKTQLQMCITILEILDCILERLFKYERFTFADVFSVPLNVAEMLLLTFKHCTNSNSFYKKLSNVNEILHIFKLANQVNNKLVTIMGHHINVTGGEDAKVPIFKNFLQALIDIGQILSCMNVKAAAANWRGYICITQKFSQVLSECYSIKNPINCVSSEIQKNLDSVLKGNKDVQNLNLLISICNFLLKIIVKLCEMFLRNDQDDWNAVFCFLLNIQRYNVSSGISQNVKDIETAVDNFLGMLCARSEFYKMFTECNQIRAFPESGLLLIFKVFKQNKFVFQSDACLTNIPRIIETFFYILSKGHFEFWKIILTSNNQTFYEDNIRNLAQTVQLLPNKEYNQVEFILFRNIVSESVWNSLMANDIWFLTIKGSPKLTYETLCNIYKHSETVLKNDFADSPQLVFLRNLLARFGTNLSEHYKQLLVTQYPLQNHFQLRKILGFKNLSKYELSNSIIKNVMDKSNLLMNKQSTVDDFNELCTGLELVSEQNKKEFLQLTVVLFDLWKFIFSHNWSSSFYFKYLIRKLLPATNNCLLEFNNDQLLVVLAYMKQLLDAEVNIKVLLGTSLTILSKKVIMQSPQQNQLITNISEILCRLLNDKNQIIQQNTLEMFFQFWVNTECGLIFQNVLINDSTTKTRISNFVLKKIANEERLSWEEYFQLHSDYKFVHQCPLLTDVERKHCQNTGKNLSQVHNNNGQEIENLLKQIKSNIGLYYKLTGKDNIMQEDTEEIMRILER